MRFAGGRRFQKSEAALPLLRASVQKEIMVQFCGRRRFSFHRNEVVRELEFLS